MFLSKWLAIKSIHSESKFLLIGVALFLMMCCVFYVIYSAHYLRPAADDYCFGAVTAQYGVIGGVVHWWNHWSGFAFSMILGNLFVGLPLALLPFSIASAIPFLSIAFAMGFLVLSITSVELKPVAKIFFISLIAFCWWLFLWLPMSIHIIPYFGITETNGLTFWQTLNGTYVIQLQILLGLLVYTSQCIAYHRGQMAYSILAILTGILAGFSGTALSVSVVVFSAVMFVGLQFTNLHTRKSWMKYWLILLIFTIMSLWICHTQSPGNDLRGKALGIHLDISITEMVRLIFTSLLQGFKKWVKFYFNIGAIGLFVLISVFSYQMAKLNFFVIKSKEFWIGLGLAFFSLLQCCVSRLADQLTYIAYWHYVSALVCVFISICLLASYCGGWLQSRTNHIQWVESVCMSFLIALIILGTYGNGAMSVEMRLRGLAWERGPANLEGVSDIEDQAGWQMDCWKKLSSHKEVKIDRK